MPAWEVVILAMLVPAQWLCKDNLGAQGVTFSLDFSLNETSY